MVTEVDMMKQYYRAKISLSQMMQISSNKYKTLVVDNKDDATKIIIMETKSDVDKSPCRFITRPKSLKNIFIQIENNEEL